MKLMAVIEYQWVCLLNELKARFVQKNTFSLISFGYMFFDYEF